MKKTAPKKWSDLSEQKKNEVISDYEDGLHKNKIARKFKISVSQVYSIIIDHLKSKTKF